MTKKTLKQIETEIALLVEWEENRDEYERAKASNDYAGRLKAVRAAQELMARRMSSLLQPFNADAVMDRNLRPSCAECAEEYDSDERYFLALEASRLWLLEGPEPANILVTEALKPFHDAGHRSEERS